MEKKSVIDGYAISSKIKGLLLKEGYVALRVVDEISSKPKNFKICEAYKVERGSFLPQGTDTILCKNDVRDYDTIILIEEDFQKGANILK